MNTSTGSHPLKLKNTMSGKREQFIPLKNNTVKLFTCGPSIYGSPHIGNYRTFLYEDILERYLEYLGYTVERMINFTDVEDKSIEKAGGNFQKLKAITEDAAENFFKYTGLFHIRTPDYIPRSSTSIDQAVQLIQKLQDKGIAYRHGNDIFYDPLRFEGFGKLYGLDMSKWPEKKRRYHRDTYEGNRWNRGDFILWHAYREKRDGDIFWKTDLGKGRPAWNVQDPAMITKNLGYQIDISCGGVDNLYRHHDYNIAVIEGVSGLPFASFWLHGEHVLLNGKKMSKSKGNILYPGDILAKGVSAAAIRLVLMTTHYRDQLNMTDEVLSLHSDLHRRIKKSVTSVTGPLTGKQNDIPEAEPHIHGLKQDFEKMMNDDLRVGLAVDALYNHLEKLAEIRLAKGLSQKQWQRIRDILLDIDSVLQVLFV